jgi:hypothetical protein
MLQSTELTAGGINQPTTERTKALSHFRLSAKIPQNPLDTSWANLSSRPPMAGQHSVLRPGTEEATSYLEHALSDFPDFSLPMG